MSRKGRSLDAAAALLLLLTGCHSFADAPRKRMKAARPPVNEEIRLVRYGEMMGRNEFEECNYAEAKRFFARAIRTAYVFRVKDPAVGEAYAGMGRCLLEEGDVAGAAMFFKAAEAGHSPETRRLVEEELETLRPR